MLLKKDNILYIITPLRLRFKKQSHIFPVPHQNSVSFAPESCYTAAILFGGRAGPRVFPPGEPSPQVTERVERDSYPLHPRYAWPPLPKGETRSAFCLSNSSLAGNYTFPSGEGGTALAVTDEVCARYNFAVISVKRNIFHASPTASRSPLPRGEGFKLPDKQKLVHLLLFYPCVV